MDVISIWQGLIIRKRTRPVLSVGKLLYSRQGEPMITNLCLYAVRGNLNSRLYVVSCPILVRLRKPWKGHFWYSVNGTDSAAVGGLRGVREARCFSSSTSWTCSNDHLTVLLIPSQGENYSVIVKSPIKFSQFPSYPIADSFTMPTIFLISVPRFSSLMHPPSLSVLLYLPPPVVFVPELVALSRWVLRRCNTSA